MNKDQWYNVLEFSRTVNADLSNYDEDGACECLISFTIIVVLIYLFLSAPVPSSQTLKGILHFDLS